MTDTNIPIYPLKKKPKGFEIVIGSSLGTAEYAAEEMDIVLNGFGFNNTLHYKPTAAVLSSELPLLFIVSTYGAGDFPDNFHNFINQLANHPHLPDLNYGILALGDKAYDTFCGAGKRLDQLLNDRQAKAYFPLQTFNVPDGLADVQVCDWIKANSSFLTCE